MGNQLLLGALFFTMLTAVSEHSLANESASTGNTILLAATEAEPAPPGFHRMPDGSLMPNTTAQTVSIDDLDGELPDGFHIMQDGTVMANNPQEALAPEGYELQADGTLIAENQKPAAATIDDFSGTAPPGFHMMPDGILMADKPETAIAPPGYHVMPDGRLMAHDSSSGSAHEHHDTSGHHGKGMWMMEYKFMRMNMDGLKDSNNDVDPYAVFYLPYGFDAVPTKMTMDMHMFMLMYGLTDKITLMGMLHYLSNDMEMLINPEGLTSSMKSSGIGDTIISASYKAPFNVELGLGISIATGSITEKDTMLMDMSAIGDPEADLMRMEMTLPYAMQLGSGSFDLIPSVAYHNNWKQFGYGAKFSYTWRTKRNSENYKLGNKLELNAFLDWNAHKNISLNSTGTLLSWGKIDGEQPDPSMFHGPYRRGSPASHPSLYGGTRIDISLGATLKTNDNRYYAKPEIAFPIYQSLWGPQMKTTWIANLSFGTMF